MKARLYSGFLFVVVLLLTACNSNNYSAHHYEEVYDEAVYEVVIYDKTASNNQPAHNHTGLIQQIEDGFFANFAVSENGEIIYSTFADMMLGVREAYVWAEADLNGNGTHELIMQAQDGFHPQMRRIISIFVVDFENQEIERVSHHNAGLVNFWFLGANGNVVFHSSSYGSSAAIHSYRQIILDETLKMHPGIWIAVEYNYNENSVRFFWEVYQINRHEFWNKLREMTGFYSIDVRPDWYITATTFVSIVRVHEDMPTLLVYRTIVGELPLLTQAGSFDYPPQEVVIRITDEDGNLIQIIDGILQGGQGGWVTGSLFEVRFDDLNFDGYMDMWLIEEVNRGTIGGYWGYYWLWCSQVGQFIKNEHLREISSGATLFANQETRQLEIHSRGGGRGPWLTRYYEWVGDEPVAASSTFIEWVNRDFVPSVEVTTHHNYLTNCFVMHLVLCH